MAQGGELPGSEHARIRHQFFWISSNVTAIYSEHCFLTGLSISCF